MQSEAAAKLELWFFRDMLESNRLRLFELFGFKPSEMDKMAKQQMVFRRILAALSTDAEPVKTAPAVEVKPLRWKGPDSYGEYNSLDGLWGYIIRCEDDGHWLTEVGDYFRSPEAAKDAAQSDYEARIRSALSAQVQDVP